MEKKYRKFTITTDKDYKGLGYAYIKEETAYLHSLTLFMFIILWTTSVKTGKRQTARQIGTKCVEIDGRFYEVEYYADVNNLPHVYYRNKLGVYIKTNNFNKYSDDNYAIGSPEWTGDKIIPKYNISIFKPDSKLEGYVKNNIFYAVKELSIG